METLPYFQGHECSVHEPDCVPADGNVTSQDRFDENTSMGFIFAFETLCVTWFMIEYIIRLTCGTLYLGRVVVRQKFFFLTNFDEKIF